MPQCPCHILSLDIVDVTGVHLVDVGGKLHRSRLDKQGNLIATTNALAEHHDDSINEELSN